MKIIKYLLGGIALIIVVFLALGFLKPEISYDCEVWVEKPMKEAWAVTQDKTKLKDWLEGFQKVEHISGTPGTIGAVSNVYFNTDGQQMVIEETITGFVPNKSISMSFGSDFMNMDYQLSMSRQEGKTKISSSTIAVGNGMFSKSIMVLLSTSIRAEEEKNLSNLKRVIEENSYNYFETEK